jgi:hypothetical protein
VVVPVRLRLLPEHPDRLPRVRLDDQLWKVPEVTSEQIDLTNELATAQEEIKGLLYKLADDVPDVKEMLRALELAEDVGSMKVRLAAIVAEPKATMRKILLVDGPRANEIVRCPGDVSTYSDGKDSWHIVGLGDARIGYHCELLSADIRDF